MELWCFVGHLKHSLHDKLVLALVLGVGLGSTYGHISFFMGLGLCLPPFVLVLLSSSSLITPATVTATSSILFLACWPCGKFEYYKVNIQNRLWVRRRKGGGTRRKGVEKGSGGERGGGDDTESGDREENQWGEKKKEVEIVMVTVQEEGEVVVAAAQGDEKREGK
ncbi:hypothetical protein ACH5RR_012383 [Cinchona calisaya]|uniref:Uncharacterized protein n=1 Tax=Cinchona calisaya TaxID=153742 RepID=A0ABD3A7M8_9GENT